MHCAVCYPLTVTQLYWSLQGCVFTKDIDRAISIADAMETGSVQVGAAAASC